MQEILLFTGDNCPACHQLKNRLKAVGLTDKVTEVNTGTDNGMERAKEYDIRAIPTMLILDNGEVKDILRGAMHSYNAIKAFLNFWSNNK